MRLDQSSVEISTIVDKIRNGDIDLQPDFQRGLVWTDSKKRRLIDTILREWYIPAVHLVVNDDLDREEVLDGQQRLQAILEFMNDGFSVDGKIEPEDEKIIRLHGLKYSKLPPNIRSRFRRFTINTVRLRDYRTAEPGELFFRLNQLTVLTAAEQRNALIGEPRNQIRVLAAELEAKLGAQKIGFSNARMNYDDTLSRLALALETGRLEEKVTASRLEKRYRSGDGFADSVIQPISEAIIAISDVISREGTHTRLNRASLFSWLYFIVDNQVRSSNEKFEWFSQFFQSFEAARSPYGVIHMIISDVDHSLHDTIAADDAGREVIRIFNDRSSSRVNDVSSVLLRDLCLNIASNIVPAAGMLPIVHVSRFEVLERLTGQLAELPADVADRALAESELAKDWERARAGG